MGDRVELAEQGAPVAVRGADAAPAAGSSRPTRPGRTARARSTRSPSCCSSARTIARAAPATGRRARGAAPVVTGNTSSGVKPEDGQRQRPAEAERGEHVGRVVDGEVEPGHSDSAEHRERRPHVRRRHAVPPAPGCRPRQRGRLPAAATGSGRVCVALPRAQISRRSGASGPGRQTTRRRRPPTTSAMARYTTR